MWGKTKTVGCGFIQHYDTREENEDFPFRKVRYSKIKHKVSAFTVQAVNVCCNEITDRHSKSLFLAEYETMTRRRNFFRVWYLFFPIQVFYCNYGPSGNYPDAPVYTPAKDDKSDVAADCEKGHDDGLCI